MGTLKPILVGREFRLRIWCGVGVLFGDMAADQCSVIEAWLDELATNAAPP